MFQRIEDRRFERLLAALPQKAASVSPKLLSPAANNALIGRVNIPRLGVAAMVIEGTSDSVLRRAVGHIPGTAMPGRQGNVAISGHRHTFSRPLRNIEPGDMILLTMLSGQYRYRVLSTTRRVA
jgi:sortase A